MKAVWFNQTYLAERLQPGTRLLLNGKLDRSGFRVATHEVVSGGRAGSGPAGLHTTGIVPVHNASARLSANRLREWVWQTVDRATDAIEPLPAELRVRRGLAERGRRAAQRALSRLADRGARGARPAGLRGALPAPGRAGDAPRRNRDGRRAAVEIEPTGELVDRWLASLPFEPTGDQRAAFEEIDADLAAGRPMQRLLMGEVGSGKTVVAVFAMLRALAAGYQAAMMAPTETLAEQHATTLGTLLGGEAIPFALLTGATPAARRRDTLDRLRTGELGLVVGTHALLEPDVEFARLAVAVVDEQHRFGVRQRAALDAKGGADAARTPCT